MSPLMEPVPWYCFDLLFMVTLPKLFSWVYQAYRCAGLWQKKVYQYANSEVFQMPSSTKVPKQATKNFILINPPRCILLALAQTHFLCHVFYSSTSSCSQQQLCYYLNHTKDQCRQSGTKHNLGPFNKYVLPQVTLGISADLSKEYGWKICAKIQLFRE